MKFKPKVIEVALKKCKIHPVFNSCYGEFTPTEALYLISLGADIGLSKSYYEDIFKACVKSGTCFIRGTTLLYFKAPPDLIQLIQENNS